MKSRAKSSGYLPWKPAFGLALLTLLAGCGDDHLKTYPQTTFAPASDFARELDWLFKYTLVLGVLVGLFVFALLGYIVWRFRYQPGHPEPEQVHGNARLELLWTFIPALILAAIAVPTVRSIFNTQREAPANAIIVEVRGWQWWWEFRYAVNGGRDTVVTANEVHVAVGTPVQLRMTAGDVLHAFWVPQMGGKRDLIPNKVNTITFTPEEPGVYLGQCAEFCGDSHALMKMRLVAHDREGFQRWLQNESEPAPAPRDSAVMLGKQLVTKGACAGCHIVRYGVAKDSTTLGRTGPNLTHFGRRRTLAAGILENNAENLAKWLKDPPAVKPGSKMPNLNLKDEEIRYIVAYLQTLQ
jgi:cytochrome c oxidase subunit 2